MDVCRGNAEPWIGTNAASSSQFFPVANRLLLFIWCHWEERNLNWNHSSTDVCHANVSPRTIEDHSAMVVSPTIYLMQLIPSSVQQREEQAALAPALQRTRVPPRWFRADAACSSPCFSELCCITSQTSHYSDTLQCWKAYHPAKGKIFTNTHPPPKSQEKPAVGFPQTP